MRTLVRKRVALAKTGVARLHETQESHIKELVRESTALVDRETGKTQVVYLELGKQQFAELKNALLLIRYSKAGRTGGMTSISRTFGWQPRIALRRNFCSASSLMANDMYTHGLLELAGRVAMQHYRDCNMALLAKHLGMAEKALPGYTLAGTPFTSGIINRNNQLRYHFDSGNFEDVWSCMFVFKSNIGGGFLSCPEYEIGFELKDCSLLMFDGQKLLHGVTPIHMNGPGAYRISVVYYSLRGMWKCLPFEEELKRARQFRARVERKRSGV